MTQVGPLELLVVAAIALIVFGPQRLPDMARTIGRTLAELRRQANEIRAEFEEGLSVDEPEHEKPARGKPARGKPARGKPARTTPVDEPEHEKPEDEKPEDEKPEDEKPEDEKPEDEKPAPGEDAR